MKQRSIKILVVDDEAIVRNSLSAWFQDEGYEVQTAANAKEALKTIETNKYQICLIDIKMPGMDGLDLQKRINKIDPDMTIIIMTAYASVQTAVEALKEGAYEYLLKPFDPEQVSHLISNAIERNDLLKLSHQHTRSLSDYEKENPIIGESKAIQNIMAQVNKVATTDSSVLVFGDSGTGKELIARSIHIRSPRRLMPMVTVNCGALPEGILESELFGHEKGAFTGAQYRRKGRFELADGGTIFLDEIGDIGAKTQSDLLRVLEEKKITRLGGSQQIEVDFRLISATNKNLRKLIEKGSFRNDLFYRINVFTIDIPPLKERVEDIIPLSRHFLEKMNKKMKLSIKGFTNKAEKLMLAHNWLGNVRELENTIERAAVVCTGGMIGRNCLNLYGESGEPEVQDKSLASMEAEHLIRVLTKNHWNISKSARILEIDRVTLYNKIKKHGLEKQES